MTTWTSCRNQTFSCIQFFCIHKFHKLVIIFLINNKCLSKSLQTYKSATETKYGTWVLAHTEILLVSLRNPLPGYSRLNWIVWILMASEIIRVTQACRKSLNDMYFQSYFRWSEWQVVWCAFALFMRSGGDYLRAPGKGNRFQDLEEVHYGSWR